MRVVTFFLFLFTLDFLRRIDRRFLPEPQSPGFTHSITLPMRKGRLTPPHNSAFIPYYLFFRGYIGPLFLLARMVEMCTRKIRFPYSIFLGFDWLGSLSGLDWWDDGILQKNEVAGQRISQPL